MPEPAREHADGFVAPPIVRRHGSFLPHWTREGATYAVAFRLADSLPTSVLERWKTERVHIAARALAMDRELTPQEVARLDELYSEKVQRYLDAGHGACWLRDSRVADIVRGALLHFDADRYDLAAWCIMPNHVHCVVSPRFGHDLPSILHSWKSFTATRANKALGRTGTFWQAESYDHLIRDQDEWRHAIDYILENPTKAGLKDWPWVWAREDRLVERPAANPGA